MICALCLCLLSGVASVVRACLGAETQVPLTRVAFMPGKVVHTNEVLTDIGQGYHVWRSAKQTREYLKRQIESTPAEDENVFCNMQCSALSHDFCVLL
jgi:prefoldin alpha subunit